MINDTEIKINSILNTKCTHSGIYCQNKKKVLETISKLASKQLNIPPKIILNAVSVRENMGSTGIGNGIAIPHGNIETVKLHIITGIFIRLKQPVDFGSIDNQPVDLIFSLLVPNEQCKMHLPLLSLITKKLTDNTTSHLLRSAKNNEELYNIINQNCLKLR